MIDADDIRRIIKQLEAVGNPHLLGRNSFILPRIDKFINETSQTGSRIGRSLTETEFCPLVYQVFGIDLTQWETIGASSTGHCPHIAVWPDHWRKIPMPLSQRPQIWVRKGYMICGQCHTVQPQATNTIPAFTVCENCLGSFAYQTKETVVAWLTRWYENRARLIRIGRYHIPYLPRGEGRYEWQLDTFDVPIAGNCVRRRKWCAYCGQKPIEQYDHIIAEKKGGHTVAENIVGACQSCNSAKGSKNATEYYRYRKDRHLPIPVELKELTLRLEQAYVSAYGQLSEAQIRQIKKPVMDAVIPPIIGHEYVFRPVVEERISPVRPVPIDGAILVAIDVSNLEVCKVMVKKDKREYLVNFASLQNK